MKAKQYWLVKTEPESYSIQDLEREPAQTTCWDGVRNYQARNLIRDKIQVKDAVLIYHSNADPPAVVGIAAVVRAAYPDPTSWDRRSHHYDPKSSADNPRWYMMDIQLQQIFSQPLGLPELRDVAALKQMELLRKGSRLSVQPVRKKEFDTIVRLAAKKQKEERTSK